MRRAPSAQADRLLGVAHAHPSLGERLHADIARQEALRELAARAELAVIPALLPLVVIEARVAVEAGRTISALWKGVSPSDLVWIDEAARSHMWHHTASSTKWRNLRPTAVPRLARLHAGEPAVLGLLGCHPSGYVREAAVKELGSVTDGREIPFLALRANDWVSSVAGRATELLARRLDPENLQAVAATFPFLVRTLAQRRRDHRSLADAIRHVLRSDGGRALLTQGHEIRLAGAPPGLRHPGCRRGHEQ